MECVFAFATGFVSKIGELVAVPIGKQIGYLVHYDENIKILKEMVKFSQLFKKEVWKIKKHTVCMLHLFDIHVKRV